MEILKDRMPVRKYWKDPEVIRNFNITLHRLFTNKDHNRWDAGYYAIGCRFNDDYEFRHTLYKFRWTLHRLGLI